MIHMSSPLQVELIAANEYVPEGMLIHVAFSIERPHPMQIFEVSEGDDLARTVVFWVGAPFAEIVEAMPEAMALAITGDTDRAIRFTHVRDLIRAASATLKSV